MPRHRWVERTGELELQLEAPDFASLLEEAALALAEIMADDARGAPTRELEHLELSTTDRETLLVDWLNELVYRAGLHKCVYVDVYVTRASDRRLEATLRGRERCASRTSVKGATWHGLRVERTPAGLEATVALDV